MCNWSLKISVYSKDTLISNTISNILPLKNFFHSITVYDKLGKYSLQNSDIIIIDIAITNQQLCKIHNMKRENSIVVLCGTAAIIDGFDDETLSKVNDIWLKPLNAKLIFFHFHRLQKFLKEKKEIIYTDSTANIPHGLDSLIEYMPYSVAITDKNSIITNINKKYTDTFKLDKKAVIGCTMGDIENKFFKEKNNPDWFLEYYGKNMYLKGKNKTLKIQKETLTDSFGNISGSLYLYTDITLEYTYQESLVQDANTDYLTKINNRRRLNDFISQVRLNHHTSLILLDLDNFKLVNDIYGHDRGDKVLSKFSSILRDHFDKENIFRLGGDEFLIVLLDTLNKDCIKAYVEKVIADFNKQIAKNFPYPKLSVSIGIATDTDKSVPFDVLLKRADNALYTSKQLGKKQFTFWSRDSFLNVP